MYPMQLYRSINSFKFSFSVRHGKAGLVHGKEYSCFFKKIFFMSDYISQNKHWGISQ